MPEARNLRGVGEALVAGEIPATDLGMDADLEYGLARDAVVVAVERRGITVSHRMPSSDVPPTMPRPDRDRNRGCFASGSWWSPPYQTTSPRRPHRSTIGTLRAFWRGFRPRVAPPREASPARAQRPQRRFVRSGRRTRVSPGLRRPSPRGAGRPDKPAEPFHHARRRLAGSISSRDEHGDGPGWSFGKQPRGPLDRPRARSFPRWGVARAVRLGLGLLLRRTVR